MSSRKQNISVDVHNVKEIAITQESFKGERTSPFKCIYITIRSEGEQEQTLAITCYTRPQPFIVTKLEGPDDLVSHKIEVKGLDQ